jgi:cell division protein ZapA (FtsZ GTPase activity inhibitor)
MGEISIKVSIANRIYPLKVKFEEEENVRKAVKLINEKIKDYEENFAVRDKQDLLAMSAIQLATELVNSDKKNAEEENTVKERIEQLNSLLTGYLQENNVLLTRV